MCLSLKPSACLRDSQAFRHHDHQDNGVLETKAAEHYPKSQCPCSCACEKCLSYLKTFKRVSPDRQRRASPPRLLHRLPSLNGVVPQHSPPSHRLRWAGRNVAVGPGGYPLRVHRRRVGLEVTELLLLLGVQPPLTSSLFWRLVKAAILI